MSAKVAPDAKPSIRGTKREKWPAKAAVSESECRAKQAYTTAGSLAKPNQTKTTQASAQRPSSAAPRSGVGCREMLDGTTLTTGSQSAAIRWT